MVDLRSSIATDLERELGRDVDDVQLERLDALRDGRELALEPLRLDAAVGRAAAARRERELGGIARAAAAAGRAEARAREIPGGRGRVVAFGVSARLVG